MKIYHRIVKIICFEMKVISGVRPSVTSFIIITFIILVLVITGILVNFFASASISRLILIILIIIVALIGISSLAAFEMYRRKLIEKTGKNQNGTSEQPILPRQVIQNGDGSYSNRNTLQV
ncbi:hypothetical protein HHI36_016997 [Cryptolaemus montrouzieri]|uniref:Uncharacterized protein n=1 Tax=Cryptolaemus montrouzieri TaxID=559131 RepID=A0ABD2NLC5_9CUCU